MKQKSLIHWFCLTGVLSLIFYHLHTLIGANHYPGYDWLSQAVSDLTATDAPSYVVANSYTTIYAIFSCLSCTLVSILVEKGYPKFLKIGIYLFTAMNFISAVGYALFPLTSSGFDHSFQSIMHVYVVTTLVVLCSVFSFIFIAIGSFKATNKHRYLGWFSIFTLLFMMLGAILSGMVPKEYFGLVERFSTYSAVIFNAILGLYGCFVFSSSNKLFQNNS